MTSLSFSTDPFQVLGLTQDATPRAIKARYFQLARRYHPNTYHGQPHSPGRPHVSRQETEDASKASMSAYFHRIHNAYTLLSKETHKRRYIEWSALEALDNEVETHRLALAYLRDDDSSSDGWSSDLEDFDTADFYRNRRGRSPGDAEETKSNGRKAQSSAGSGSGTDTRGRRKSQVERLKESGRGDSAQRAATERRKKLNRIRRKEVEVFEAYREAKLVELEAQIEAERLREIYDKTRAKREKIEKIPMETSTRVKMISNIVKATKLLRATPKPVASARRPSLQTTFINDDFVSISSPISARAGLALHRRGFSSDISGDQTDSDEETPHPPHRHPYRSPTPTGRHPAGRSPSPAPQIVPILRPVQLPQHKAYSLNALAHEFSRPHHDVAPPPDSPSLLDPKFKLFVKRPTGFSEHELEDMTSPISPIAYTNNCREVIHLPDGVPLVPPAPPDTDTAAGAAQLPHDSDSDLSPARQGMFALKVIGKVRFHDHIAGVLVHKLNTREGTNLLGAPQDLETDPEDLLEQLRAWDRKLAGRFMVKLDVRSKFVFRLICNQPDVSTRKHRSFLALSYRRQKIVSKKNDGYSLPLSPEMMQAVWEERLSDEEGIWIDQISIDQDSNAERDLSMVAMDLVYRGARLIVVVLDDFELSTFETAVLSHHMEEYERMRHVSPHKRFRKHSPPWLEQQEELFKVVNKILGASWFRRAWCRHEMRLARDHIFLIPCTTDTGANTTIIRLSSSCLAHLLALAAEVAFNPAIELLKPALHAFFQDRTHTLKGSEQRSSHGNFTAVAAEVFRMEAGGDPRLPPERQEADARWDKMSIILNAMECGLALRPLPDGTRQVLSTAECHYSLLMLALAARDPGALCSVGKPLQLKAPNGKDVPSWLFEPTVVDAGLNNSRTLKRLPLDSPLRTGISRGRHWVQLDLKILSEEQNVKRGTAADDADMKELAKSFVERCEQEKWGRQRRRYILHDAKANDNFGSMTEVYIQTLTGVFSCGPDWMSSISHRYGVARWRQDLQPAYWLMVNIVSMKGRWPTFERKEDDWTARAASYIMDFTNFLVIRGMPQRQLRRPETWRPMWVTTRNRGKVLTFSPDRTDIVPAVPSPLLSTEYRDLARSWILKPGPAASQWILLGKSVLFSDDLAKLVVNCEDEQVVHHQTVFGRILL